MSAWYVPRMRRQLSIAVVLLALTGTALAQAVPALTTEAPQTAHIAAEPSLTLTIDAPQEIVIDAIASSDDRDAELRLMQGETIVADDSDSGEGTHARLAQFVAPGTYQVIVWERQYREMTSSIQVVAAPAMTPVATIAADGTSTAVTTPEGDWARAASVEVTLSVPTDGNYVITGTPSEQDCSPELTLIRQMRIEGAPLVGAGSGAVATATRALSAGTYTLRVRNWWGHARSVALAVAPAAGQP